MIKKISTLHIELELLTGLHIGGYDSTFDIGGADSEVMKNPLNKQPYIPGSSLKGKLKSLLAYTQGKAENNDIIIEDESVRNLFESVVIENDRPSITRAIFRDLTLTKDSLEKLKEILGEGIYTEVKAENSINKLSGTAKSPRFIERVPAGVSFEGSITVTFFEGDEEQKMIDAIERSLELLEMNYLGGSGSRGYGRVKVVKKVWEDESL